MPIHQYIICHGTGAEKCMLISRNVDPIALYYVLSEKKLIDSMFTFGLAFVIIFLHFDTNYWKMF